MKTVMEIIFAIILLVGGANISEETLLAFKKESLKKVYKGIPSLDKFTRVLTKKLSRSNTLYDLTLRPYQTPPHLPKNSKKKSP